MLTRQAYYSTTCPYSIEYWINWLTDRATYCACMCAEHFQNDPTFAGYMSTQFELYEERAWLLTVEPASVIKVVQG